MPIAIKICGLRNVEAAITAAELGATHLGFVFFPKSPRFVEPAAAEEIITELKQSSLEKGFALPGLVGLFVDAGEKQLAETAPFLTHFQFHGHESPARCATIRDAFGLEIIKAIPVSAAADASGAGAYAGPADMLLFDARAPKGAERPGGHGVAFDWTFLSAYTGATPFLVAGGLIPENVGAAITAARGHPAFAGVDVSSGVEDSPGRKSPAKMKAFIDAAGGAAH